MEVLVVVHEFELISLCLRREQGKWGGEKEGVLIARYSFNHKGRNDKLCLTFTNFKNCLSR